MNKPTEEELKELIAKVEKENKDLSNKLNCEKFRLISLSSLYTLLKK